MSPSQPHPIGTLLDWVAIEPSSRQSILIVDYVIEIADGLVFRIGGGNTVSYVLIFSRGRAGNEIGAIRIFYLEKIDGHRIDVRAIAGNLCTSSGGFAWCPRCASAGAKCRP